LKNCQGDQPRQFARSLSVCLSHGKPSYRIVYRVWYRATVLHAAPIGRLHCHPRPLYHPALRRWWATASVYRLEKG